MRGVYGDALGHQPRTSGSSTRARGLPRQTVRAAGVLRIIPACAGFTRRPRRPRPPPPDHPRMRGVYVDVMTISAHRAGSSPHARGLLRRRRDSPSWGGIIPACAGFTARVIATAGFRGDHPRMRGVYGARARGNRRHEGSSPHARGLPDGGHGVGQADRIIPACAGFTPGRSRCCSRWGDHPRMRGVYLRPAWGAQDSAGSSPHARGLLGDKGLVRPGGRIIPACAGFTFPATGIIPARAGFTISSRPSGA